MSGSPQFFISYDETYHSAAAALHERLLRELRGTFGRDIDIFLDHRDIAGGDEWRQQIEDGLASLSVLIALVNDAFVTRPYCRYELDSVRKRREGGDPCRIVTVRFQGDSEIYRKSTDSASRIEAADRTYLASLDDEERRVVTELREIQCVDGVALRESDPDSRDYNTALFGLARAVAQQYREVRAARNTGETSLPPETKEPKQPKPKVPIAAVLGVVVVLVLGAAGAWFGGVFGGGETISGDNGGGDGGGGDDGTTVVEKGLVWEPAGMTVITNNTDKPAIAYAIGETGPDTDTPLDQIQPGTDRPEAGLEGEIARTCIDGLMWLKYPVPGDPGEAMIFGDSVGLFSGC